MANQTIDVSMVDFRAETIGQIAQMTGSVDIDFVGGAASAISGAGAGVAGGVTINGTDIGSSVGLDTVSTSYADLGAIAKAAAINASSVTTGVSAQVEDTVLTGTTAITGGTTVAGTLSINNVEIITVGNTTVNLLAPANSDNLKEFATSCFNPQIMCLY